MKTFLKLFEPVVAVIIALVFGAPSFAAHAGEENATEAKLHTPLPGYYHSQAGRIFHLDDDGSYQIDRALDCKRLKQGKPSRNYVRELTFRCQGHPYPNVKPQFIILKERWYATTLDGKLFLTTNDGNDMDTEIYQYDGVNPK